MERETIVTAFISGLIARDLMSSDIGNGVIINRIKDIEYQEVEDPTAETEDTIEVIKDQLQVVYNGRQMYLIDLTELEIETIQDVLDYVILDYDTYVTDKTLNSFV